MPCLSGPAKSSTSHRKYPAPYRHNTFGNLITCSGLELKDDTLQGSGKRFDIRIHALGAREPGIDRWIKRLEHHAARPLDVAADWKARCLWWSDFWDFSPVRRKMQV